MTAQSQWYYVTAQNERQGPVEAADLLEKFKSGKLTAQTLVWRDGMAEWQPFSTVQAQLTEGAGLDASHPAQGSAPVEATGDVASSTATPDGNAASPYAAPASSLILETGTVVTGNEIVMAGFWKRVAASVIDGLIVGTISYGVMMVLVFVGIGVLGLRSFDMNEDTLGLGAILYILLQLVLLVLNAAYYVLFHASKNMATLGKMVVGIKVVRLNGERISVARAIGRYFALMLGSMTMGIGFIMAGFTQRKQALHDIICDTLVVDKWAFTDTPERQQKGLGAVTIVILVIFGALFALVLLFAMAAIVSAITQMG